MKKKKTFRFFSTIFRVMLCDTVSPVKLFPNKKKETKNLKILSFLLSLIVFCFKIHVTKFVFKKYATQKLMLDSSKMVQKQCEAFHTFLWHFFHV